MSKVILPLPVKVFSREHPATKVDMCNCFWNGKAFTPRAVIQARGIIGLNVPKYLLRENLAEVSFAGDVEMLTLTKKGERWLTEGLAKHLKRHPEQAADLAHKPPTMAAKRPHCALPAPSASTVARRPREGLQTPYKRPR